MDLVVQDLLVDIIDGVEKEAEKGEEVKEESLDKFIIFRRGVDYRFTILPDGFMDELYEESYARGKK